MILITGANGFIGSCLLADLVARGHYDLIAVDSVGLQERPQLLQRHSLQKFLLSGELFDYLQTPAAKKIAVVFHMGACSSTTEMNEAFLRENNTEFSMRLFEFCSAQKIPYICASSAATYGGGEKGFDDEASSEVYQPLNPYGWSKLRFDQWASKQRITPPRWAALRFFNVFGPNEYHKGEMSSVVFKAFHQIQQSGQLKLFRSHRPDYRDGEQKRDFVYVKDVTQWMIEIWQAPQFRNGIYNMGFGKARTWLDLAAAVFASLNREVRIDWIDMPAHVRNQYQYFTQAKMTKLFGEGMAPPRFSLEHGIDDYIKKYLSPGLVYL